MTIEMGQSAQSRHPAADRDAAVAASIAAIRCRRRIADCPNSHSADFSDFRCKFANARFCELCNTWRFSSLSSCRHKYASADQEPTTCVSEPPTRLWTLERSAGLCGSSICWVGLSRNLRRMIYERLVWEGMPVAAQRTNSKSADEAGLRYSRFARAASLCVCSMPLPAFRFSSSMQPLPNCLVGLIQTKPTPHGA